MECASCRADLDAGDRYCPACRMPNLLGSRHPRFGPPERDPGPIVAPRVLAPGARPCPRCHDGIRTHDNYCRSCGLDVSRLAPPPPTSRSVGVWTTPGPQGLDAYRPLGVSTIVLQLIVVVIAVIGIVLALVSLMQWRNLDGGAVPLLTLPRADVDWPVLQDWATQLAVVQIGLVVIASALMVSWTSRAYRNLAGLGAKRSKLSPIWATLGWFVPGVNLVMPKAIIDQTWRASDPRFSDDGANMQQPIPTINHLWWVCTLVALPTVVMGLAEMINIGSLAPVGLPELHAARATFILVAVAELLLLFAAVLFIATVGGIADRQRLRAMGMGTPKVLRPPPEAIEELPEPVEELEPVVTTVLIQPLAAPAPPRPALVHMVGGDTRAGRY